MADYKELLRKAVEALPENNGAARRAVYEKARAALVGQLRAINPPLPARDITTHRLQLEDCIRQVEQEASEAVIAGMGSGSSDSPPPPVYFDAPAAAKPPLQIAKPAAPKPAPPKPAPAAREQKALPTGGSIEDIIAAANAETTAPEAKPKRQAGKPVQMRLASPVPRQSEPEPEAADEASEAEPADILPPKPALKANGRPLPSIVARAEAAKGRSGPTAFSVPGERPFDGQRRAPQLEPRATPRLEPAARGNQAVARQQIAEPAAFIEEPRIAAAMSAVREVEVEPQPADPQGAIDRAIATLDREARGEQAPDINGVEHEQAERPNGKLPGGLNGLMPGRKAPAARTQPVPPARQPKAGRGREALAATRRNRGEEAEMAFPRARRERAREGLSAVTIFLIVFAVLLVGTGGAGFWAVSQGYLDLSSMFSPVATQPQAEPSPAATISADAAAPATGPGNTTAPAASPAPVTELAGTERLTPDPALTGNAPLALAAAPPPAARTEERLVSAEQAATAEAAVAAVDSSSVAGSQSLLLEAAADGTTGAVPFSGSVDWTKGSDETGQPTLVGKANIPARNLAVDVLIRKNSDPSLPASHLMEINFKVSDSFIGGSVAGLPGVLLKNEELVQGTPLVGASARVVGNSFLFALSASASDLSNNVALLTNRKWMDLALIYATGTRAIITLEKDATAEALFRDVFATWGQTAAN